MILKAFIDAFEYKGREEMGRYPEWFQEEAEKGTVVPCGADGMHVIEDDDGHIGIGDWVGINLIGPEEGTMFILDGEAVKTIFVKETMQ